MSASADLRIAGVGPSGASKPRSAPMVGRRGANRRDRSADRSEAAKFIQSPFYQIPNGPNSFYRIATTREAHIPTRPAASRN
jgi:hypothetical protein